MFCKNCGAEINDSARFCPTCGATVEGIEIRPTGAVADVVADRNKVLSDIDIAYKYAEQAEVYIGNLYDLQGRRDTLTALKQAGRKQRKQLLKTLKDYGYDKPKKFRVLKYILFFLSLFVGAGYELVMIPELRGVGIFLSIVSIGIFAGAIVLHILGKKEIKNAFNDIDNIIATDGQHYYDEGCRILSEYVTNYGVISSNYMNTRALDYMRQTIIDGRADTLKEALNLFVGYENQLRLERAQDEHYQELLLQQEEIKSDVKKGQAASDIGDALILFGLLFR